MLQRQHIGHRGSQACDHVEMPGSTLPRAEQCTTECECTLQDILSTPDVVVLSLRS